MSIRVLIVLACVAVVGLFSTAATLVGIAREKSDLQWVAKQLNQQFTAELSRTVQQAALLSRNIDVRAALRADARADGVQDALNRLVIETALVSIMVADAEGEVVAQGLRNPDIAFPLEERQSIQDLRRSPAALSRRFVRDSDKGWKFEVAKAIDGPGRNVLGYVIVYQSLEDQAQYWRALPDQLILSTLDGEILYEHDRFDSPGWTPLQVSTLSQIHGTRLLVERNPQVLLAYGSLGFLIGALLMLAVLFGLSSASRRRQLTEAKMNMLAENAAILEARVEDRTSALRKEIRQHKETELALQESQSQLVQTAKFKVLNDLASGLSHEISQPLFALEATLDTVKCHLGAQSEAARKSVEKAQRVTQRMGRILINLKSFARNEPLAPVPVEISDAVTSALEIMEHEAAGSLVSISHERPAVPTIGMATPTRLQQVIINLVSNSIDAVEKDGSGTIHIDYVDGNSGPEIHIRDNGPGFPDPIAALTPFYSTKENRNGLGLGLSISADIMQGFGGSLNLSETNEGGACVILCFEPGKAANER